MDYFNTGYCPRCNAVLEPGAHFCVMCGATLESSVSDLGLGGEVKYCSCGTENDADAKFCVGCGKPFDDNLGYDDGFSDVKYCSCGTENDADAKFCVGCGKPFDDNSDYNDGFSDVKYCSCGMENDADAKFCVGCGKPFNEEPVYDSSTVDTPASEDTNSTVCSVCGTLNEPGNVFCTGCAAPLSENAADMRAPMRCPECNGIIEPYTGKCGICGYSSLGKRAGGSDEISQPVHNGTSGKDKLIVNMEHKPERVYTNEMERAKKNFKATTDFDV